MVKSQKALDETMRDVPVGRYTEQLLANENIFLAWIRTGLTLMSFGFVVNQFGFWLQEFAFTLSAKSIQQPSGASVYIGIGMVICGGLLCVLAAWRYYKVAGQIRRGEVRADRGLVEFVTALTLLLTVVMAVFMYLTSRQF